MDARLFMKITCILDINEDTNDKNIDTKIE